MKKIQKSIWNFLVSSLKAGIMEPRKLTEAEINETLDLIKISHPPDLYPGRAYSSLSPEEKELQDRHIRGYGVIYGLSEEIRASVLQSMKEGLREQLREINLAPAMLPKFRQTFIERFNKAQITPGDTVGIAAATAISAQQMQMTLNSFHKSGSGSNVSYGVKSLQEVLSVSKNRSIDSCTLHFTRPITFDEVFDTRYRFIETSIRDLMIDEGIIDAPQNLEQYWWHTAYPLIFGKPLPISSQILRLRFDNNKMFTHRITMEKIISVLTQVHQQCIVCIPSPVSISGYPILDIYPVENILTQVKGFKSSCITEEKSALVFLETMVRPRLKDQIVSGIKNIKNVYPVINPVWQIVREESKAFQSVHIEAARRQGEKYAKILERTWFLGFNLIRLRISGVTVDHLTRLLTHLGIQYGKTTEMKILDQFFPPGNRFTTIHPHGMFILMPEGVTEKPGKYLQNLLEADKKAEDEYEEARQKAGERLYRRPPSELMNLANYITVDTLGNNFETLINLPDIDPNYTLSNNIHEINNLLGIEAARNFMIMEITNIVANAGSYINPRHIELLIDFMTSLGEPLPITFSGTSKQNNGPLTKSSNERAMLTFTDAAAMGQVEAINSATTSIFVGQAAAIGTGMLGLIAGKGQPVTQVEISTPGPASVDDYLRELNVEESLGMPELGMEFEEPDTEFGEFEPFESTTQMVQIPPPTIVTAPALPVPQQITNVLPEIPAAQGTLPITPVAAVGVTNINGIPTIRKFQRKK